jgi:hypothetical protein
MAAETTLTTPYYIGEDNVIHFTVFQSDRTSIQDVTGYTFSLKILKSDAVVISNTPAIVVAANGTVDATLASADTSSLKPGIYEYYFRRTNSGSRTILAHGTLELLEAPSWT